MRLVQDPVGRWIGRPAFAGKLSGNRRPIAILDTATAETDGPSILIDVLANDIDPESGALTLVSAYAALGTATVETGQVRYTPPPGFSGADTVVYEISDDIGQTDTGQVDVTVVSPTLSVEATADNRIEITAATGPITIDVTEPAAFAGSYATDLADLGTGPANLAPPALSGGTAVGETVTASPGLWLHTASETPIRTWSWTRDGVPIAEATGASHVVTAQDAGRDLAAVETLADGFGTRMAASAVVAVPSATFEPSQDAALIGWWDADDAATLTTSGNLASAWADKTGGAALTQATGIWMPQSGTRELNGRNVLDFNAADGDHMVSSRSLPASGDVALHMVVVIDGAASEYASLVALEATNDFQIDAGAPAAFEGRLNAAGIGTPTALSGGPFSGPTILSVVLDLTGAGTAEVFVGGQLRGTMALTAAVDPTALLHVMTNRSKNAGIDGAVAEIVLTGDITNRADHHSYLATKWGLS